MRAHPNQSSRPNRRGIVLLAVLLVVVILTLAAYQYSEWMTAEYKAADSFTRLAQAQALAESGVHFAAAALSTPDSISSSLSGKPFDNVQAFQNVLVKQNETLRFQGRFSIVAPLD